MDGLQLPDDPDLPVRAAAVGPVVGLAVGPVVDRVSRVVPARQLEQEARAAATKIAEKGQVAVLAIKEAVNRSQEVGLSEGLAYERRLFEALFATEDQSEGMAAFREKREPQYRDR